MKAILDMKIALDMRIGRYGAWKAMALATWAGALAFLSFTEAMAPAPSLSSNGHLALDSQARGVVQAPPVKGDILDGSDHPVESFVYGAFVGSTIASDKIVSMDLRAASAVPGVIAIYPRESTILINHPQRDRGGDAAAPIFLSLPNAEVLWKDRHIALVLAATPRRASEAAGLIRIVYEQEGPVGGPDASRTSPQLMANVKSESDSASMPQISPASADEPPPTAPRGYQPSVGSPTCVATAWKKKAPGGQEPG
jgi:hypothetical protein